MDAERWMILHPTIDMKAAVKIIKDYYKDDLFQIIMFGPSVREDYRKRKNIDVQVLIVLNHDEESEKFLPLLDELIEITTSAMVPNRRSNR